MLDQLADKLQSALGAIELRLWGIEFAGTTRNRILRIFIDKPEQAVDIDDCVRATQHLRVYLAVEYPQALDYAWEISSPGINRTLFSAQQCRDYIGHNITGQLLLPLANGRKRIRGLLQAVDSNNELTITDAQGESYALAFNKFIKIKLAN